MAIRPSIGRLTAGARCTAEVRKDYSATTVNCAVIVIAGAGSKNCGLIAKIAGTVKLVALLAATVLLMRGPVKTEPETA